MGQESNSKPSVSDQFHAAGENILGGLGASSLYMMANAPPRCPELQEVTPDTTGEKESGRL